MESSRKLFYHLQLLVIVLIVSSKATFEHSTHGIKCLEKEKQALLNFKDQVIDKHDQLSSWGNENDKKDCCKWRGVRCDNRTNHIIGLNLDGTYLEGNISILLLEIPHLKYVHLSSNEFKYSRVSQFISSDDGLQYLDLSGNGYSPPSLIFPLSIIFDLTYLSYLDLSFHKMGGLIPNAIGNLSSLRYLSLWGCHLEGGVPIFLGNLSRLEYLDLSENNLTGTVSHLALSSSLRVLKLDENMFNGTVTQIFRNLYKLESLTLLSNHFEDIITDSHFSNLSKLSMLDMSFNKGILFNFSLGWNPPFQLTSLGLGSCKIGPNFPTWLTTQRELEVLEISNAGISGTSDWLWELSPNLGALDVSHNNFHGALLDLSSKFPNIFEIDFSFNHFSGSIPILPPQGDIDLSSNEFSGSITKICNKNNLDLLTLKLSNNQLSGPLPDCFANLTSLEFLILANNNFSGKIPALNSKSLKSLHLQNNSFTGEIPTTLSNCTSLVIIDLSQNKLTGKIPTWAGNTWTNLVFLNLGSNEFVGRIPPKLCHLAHVQVLDFSLNKISGHIPKCLSNLTAMSQVYNEDAPWPVGIDLIEHAYLMWKTNALLFDEYSLQQVKLIDLSNNNLVGNVPPEIASLVELIGLNLSRNNLSGFIPPKIGEIKPLNFLDLSRNHFSGNIPDGVSQLDRLGVLDLSYNNLSGRIPQSNHMRTFGDSSFEGNPSLCGIPLVGKPCPGDEIARDPKNINDDNVDGLKKTKEDDNFIDDGFYISTAIGFVVGFWGVWVTLVFNNSWRIALFRLWNMVMDWLYVKTIISKRRVKEAFYKFVRL